MSKNGSVFLSVRGKMVGLSSVCLSPGPEASPSWLRHAGQGTGWRKAREVKLR